MKKIILLSFTLIALGVSAQDYAATVYFADGTVKQGTSDFIKSGMKKIKFKENNSAKSEKFETENLKKIEYYNSKTQEPIIFERLTYIGGYKKKGTIPITFTGWLQLVKQSGDITVYTSQSSSNGYYNMGTGNMFSPTDIKRFYFQYKNEMTHFVYANMSDPMIGKKKYMGFFISKFFNDICPDLVAGYNDNTLKVEENPMVMLEYYEKNCNPNNKE